MVKFTINGQPASVEADPAMPILWVVRERLGLTGTKFGCGAALCGACTVHLDGQPVRSCSTPIAEAEGKAITTIEGIAGPDGELSKVQQAWISEQVPQCGFCQNGQILTAKALLDRNPRPTDAEIRQGMQGALCRCMTYYRVQAAVKRAASALSSAPRTPSGDEVVR